MNLLLDDLNKFENGVIFFNFKDINFLRKKINFKTLTTLNFLIHISRKEKG